VDSSSLSRRTFLVDTARVATVGWLALDLGFLAACARDGVEHDARRANLTAAEMRALRAFAAQILPSENGLPGANEAGAADFVDRALGMPFFADSAPVVRSGLADLDARARAAGQKEGFAPLPSATQTGIMVQIQSTPFFAAARTLVIIGTLADPSYGGNRGGAGWTLLGMEHRPSFTVPYGWYDEQAASAGKA
jgi:gluconate 2-dehydrogenase gamma chain